MWADNNVVPATFENLTVDANGLYRSDKPTENGFQQWESGSFTFSTYVDASYAQYGMYYYYDVAVSAKTETDFVNDYSAGYDMKSAPGGAAVGNNYAVWYLNYYGNADVLINTSTTLSGMYVTLNTYAKSSILNGDGYAKKFETGDWFKLTVKGCTQSAGGVIEKGSIDFYLADFREEGNWKLADQWMWLDLTSLGEVGIVRFSLSSSDTGNWGMNTPAYFCFDELGGEAPANPAEYTIVSTTGIEEIGFDTANNKSLQPGGQKLFIDGRLYIRRGNQLIDVANGNPVF